jgi:hypothetical protein
MDESFPIQEIDNNQNQFVEIQKGKTYDDIIIGDTDVVFRLWNKTNNLELVFLTEEKGDLNPENVVKLSLGLLGFYRWANSNEGREIVSTCDSTSGGTNINFVRTLQSLLEKGGHPDLLFTDDYGGENIYVGLNATKFARLSPDDPLIEYLERIEKRHLKNNA